MHVSATVHSVTDGQTDDIMMPIADHLAKNESSLCFSRMMCFCLCYRCRRGGETSGTTIG